MPTFSRSRTREAPIPRYLTHTFTSKTREATHKKRFLHAHEGELRTEFIGTLRDSKPGKSIYRSPGFIQLQDDYNSVHRGGGAGPRSLHGSPSPENRKLVRQVVGASPIFEDPGDVVSLSPRQRSYSRSRSRDEATAGGGSSSYYSGVMEPQPPNATRPPLNARRGFGPPSTSSGSAFGIGTSKRTRNNCSLQAAVEDLGMEFLSRKGAASAARMRQRALQDEERGAGRHRFTNFKPPGRTIGGTTRSASRKSKSSKRAGLSDIAEEQDGELSLSSNAAGSYENSESLPGSDGDHVGASYAKGAGRGRTGTGGGRNVVGGPTLSARRHPMGTGGAAARVGSRGVSASRSTSNLRKIAASPPGARPRGGAGQQPNRLASPYLSTGKAPIGRARGASGSAGAARSTSRRKDTSRSRSPNDNRGGSMNRIGGATRSLFESSMPSWMRQSTDSHSTKLRCKNNSVFSSSRGGGGGATNFGPEDGFSTVFSLVDDGAEIPSPTKFVNEMRASRSSLLGGSKTSASRGKSNASSPRVQRLHSIPLGGSARTLPNYHGPSTSFQHAATTTRTSSPSHRAFDSINASKRTSGLDDLDYDSLKAANSHSKNTTDDVITQLSMPRQGDLSSPERAKVTWALENGMALNGPGPGSVIGLPRFNKDMTRTTAGSAFGTSSNAANYEDLGSPSRGGSNVNYTSAFDCSAFNSDAHSRRAAASDMSMSRRGRAAGASNNKSSSIAADFALAADRGVDLVPVKDRYINEKHNAETKRIEEELQLCQQQVRECTNRYLENRAQLRREEQWRKQDEFRKETFTTFEEKYTPHKWGPSMVVRPIFGLPGTVGRSRSADFLTRPLSPDKFSTRTRSNSPDKNAVAYRRGTAAGAALFSTPGEMFADFPSKPSSRIAAMAPPSAPETRLRTSRSEPQFQADDYEKELDALLTGTLLRGRAEGALRAASVGRKNPSSNAQNNKMNLNSGCTMSGSAAAGSSSAATGSASGSGTGDAGGGRGMDADYANNQDHPAAGSAGSAGSGAAAVGTSVTGDVSFAGTGSGILKEAVVPLSKDDLKTPGTFNASKAAWRENADAILFRERSLHNLFLGDKYLAQVHASRKSSSPPTTRGSRMGVGPRTTAGASGIPSVESALTKPSYTTLNYDYHLHRMRLPSEQAFLRHEPSRLTKPTYLSHPNVAGAAGRGLTASAVEEFTKWSPRPKSRRADEDLNPLLLRARATATKKLDLARDSLKREKSRSPDMHMRGAGGANTSSMVGILLSPSSAGAAPAPAPKIFQRIQTDEDRVRNMMASVPTEAPPSPWTRDRVIGSAAGARNKFDEIEQRALTAIRSTSSIAPLAPSTRTSPTVLASQESAAASSSTAFVFYDGGRGARANYDDSTGGGGGLRVSERTISAPGTAASVLAPLVFPSEIMKEKEKQQRKADKDATSADYNEDLADHEAGDRHGDELERVVQLEAYRPPPEVNLDCENGRRLASPFPDPDAKNAAVFSAVLVAPAGAAQSKSAPETAKFVTEQQQMRDKAEWGAAAPVEVEKQVEVIDESAHITAVCAKLGDDLRVDPRPPGPVDSDELDLASLPSASVSRRASPPPSLPPRQGFATAGASAKWQQLQVSGASAVAIQPSQLPPTPAIPTPPKLAAIPTVVQQGQEQATASVKKLYTSYSPFDLEESVPGAAFHTPDDGTSSSMGGRLGFGLGLGPATGPGAAGPGPYLQPSANEGHESTIASVNVADASIDRGTGNVTFFSAHGNAVAAARTAFAPPLSMTATASGFARTGSNFETAVSTTPASMGVAHAFSTSSLNKGAAPAPPVVASSAGPRPQPAAASSSFTFAQEDEIESQTGSAAGQGIRNHNKNDPPPPHFFYPELQMEVDPQARPAAAAAAHLRTEDTNRPTAKKPPSPFLLKLQEERLKRHTLMKQRGF